MHVCVSIIMLSYIYSLHARLFYMCFCRLQIFFKIIVFKKFFQKLDPDVVRHFVGPDLGPNCLQRLSADNTSR